MNEIQKIKISSLPEVSFVTEGDCLLVVQNRKAKRANPELFKGAQGEPGESAHMRFYGDYLQWKVGVNGTWINLLPVKDITGPSAYQSAVRYGFNGTESEWLASLSAASEAAAEMAGEAARKADECRDHFTREEAQRQTAESSRVQAENNRVSAENKRVVAESEREKTERSRQETEEIRITSEQERQKTHSQSTKETKEAIDYLYQSTRLFTPTRLEVSYPKRITIGNPVDPFIRATLYPEGIGQNILFQQLVTNNDSVVVDPYGRLEILQPGKTKIYIIPTANTQLLKTAEIEVVPAAMRLTGTGKIRLTGNWKIRTT